MCLNMCKIKEKFSFLVSKLELWSKINLHWNELEADNKNELAVCPTVLCCSFNVVLKVWYCLSIPIYLYTLKNP